MVVLWSVDDPELMKSGLKVLLIPDSEVHVVAPGVRIRMNRQIQ